MAILTVAVTAALTAVMVPFVVTMLKAAGAVRGNYRGDQVPVSVGIVFIPAIITGSFLIMIVHPEHKEIMLLGILGAAVMGFVGIIDDLLGSRSVLGFKGHLKSLLEGRLTTGGFKAIIGGIVAASISIYISTGAGEWILNVLVIALFTNLLNLSDLRPGRAIKLFFMLWFISFIPAFNQEYRFLLYPLIGGILAYMPTDIKAKGMMGDVGSNVLGIAMGLYYCLISSVYLRMVILVILVFLQLVGERYSFTAIIDRNRILSFIDGLGRGKVGGYNDKD
ncbi:MAG: Undecaprenyl-phosphate N-acetylglucosaminyl 1-phosphate transferase [Firmicutes bacterium]|nr:Undecaprenyl-phosphate N-acetylglucosaminyl 1-phosphate transferase [Bacillota bacterium]MDI6706030.1 hypothetical protein [Bacillota bacterium]